MNIRNTIKKGVKVLIINEKTINNFKQNKIKYLVRDFTEYGVPEEVTREILLKRGINKWLANRMAIINLKDELKNQVKFWLKSMEVEKKYHSKNSLIYRQFVGILETTISIRQRIRSICHSSRWQFPE